MMADHSHHGEGQHDEGDVTVPAVPGAGLVVIKPQLVLGGFELSSMAQRCPSTLTNAARSVPAGHKVEKKGQIAVAEVAPDQGSVRSSV